MRAALDADVPPSEPGATCHACAMCDGPASPPRAVEAFAPSIGCCTYIPTLSNVTVGRIVLGDETLGGRRSVVARIEGHVAVTPLGLGWPHAQSELYRDTKAHFGRHEGLRCPHHIITPDGGRCGIWQHRNATCATWFCRHERGAVGRRVWMAIRDVLGVIDERLAWHAVDALGISAERRERLVPRAGLLRGYDLVDGHRGPPTREHRALVWGRWLGRETAFFEACAQLVDAYSWSDIRQLCGRSLDAPLAELHTAVDALATRPLPTAPVKGPVVRHVHTTETTLVSGYSTYDAVVMSTAHSNALDVFDGAPLELVQARLHAAGVTVDDATLRHWLDTEILLSTKDTR